jgi:hypothetical protein
MNSQSLDEILSRSGQAVTSLCLTLVLTAAPVAYPARSSTASRSLVEQPRCISLFTHSTSTEASTSIGLRLPVAEQLAKLFVTLSGERNVPLLAYISNVSKNTYYGWLRGDSISPENEERLTNILTLLAGIAKRHHNLAEFLTSPSDIGSPAEQLRAGRLDVALGMSYVGGSVITPRQSGRPLRSVPFVSRAVTSKLLRTARAVRDVLDAPNPDAYAELDSDSETAALGRAVVVG